MRKKLLSVILVLNILMPSNILFVNAVEDDVPIPDRLTVGIAETDNSSYENIYGLLSYLGIVDENLDEINMKKNPTRAYTAKIAAKLVNENISEITEKPYSDVSLTHEYAAGVAAAKKYNIIEEAEMFYPDRNVTYSAVASWFIKAMKIDMLKPENMDAFSFATEMEFFDGVLASPEKSPTYEELFAVIENVLNADVVNVNITGDGASVSSNEEETYLSRRNIMLQKGIVTGIGYSSYDGDEILKSDEIEINKQKFNTLKSYDDSLFAKAVCAYVDLEDGLNIAIAVWEDNRKNNCYETENLEEAEFYADRIIFNDENDKKVKTDNNTYVFENDVRYSLYRDEYSSVTLKNADKMRIIDNNGDSIADVILVYKYENYILNSVSTISNSLSFLYGGEGIKLGEDNVYSEIFINGSPVTVSELKNNDVLTVIEVLRRTGEMTYKIEVSRNVANGIITQIDNSDGRTRYKINDVFYPLSKEYEKFLKEDTSVEKPALNKAGDFYINVKGEIVYANISGEYLYGILRKAIFDEETETYSLKMYTTNSKFERITMSEKVTFYSENILEGKKLTDDEIYNHLLDGSGKTLDTVVAYKIKQDKISELALPLDRKGYTPGTIDYPLTKDYICGTDTENTGEASRIYMDLLAGRFFIKNTKTVTIPVEAEYKDDEKQYKVTTALSTKNVYADKTADTSPGMDAVVKIYNADKFHIPAFATIEKKVAGDSASMSVGGATVMVTGVETTVNEDNEPVMKISYNSGGNTVSSIINRDAVKVESKTGEIWVGTEGDLSEIKKGDIIQFETNATGEISAVRIMFRLTNKGSYRIQNGSSESVSAPQKNFTMISNISVVYGKLIDKNGKILIVNVSDSGKDEEYQYVYYVTNTFRSNTYTVVDESTVKCYNASINELQPGDDVVLIRQWSTVEDVYMIR